MLVQTSKSLFKQLNGLCQPFFKALCEPNRLELLAGLCAVGRPCTVGEIAARSPLDLSVVSRHLAVMRDAGVLCAKRDGREVYYSVPAAQIAGTLRQVADLVERAFGAGQKGAA